MYASVRISAIYALFLAVGVVGCDGGDPAGLPDEFDAAAVESAVDAALTPLRAITGPTAAVRDAFGSLTDQGLSFDRAPLAGVGSHLVPLHSGVARNTEFPVELQGKTFVLDEQTQTWGSDSTRTSAPAAGVRVIWYDTDPGGNFLLPLEEKGYVDLTDEDQGATRSAIGIRMVATTDTGDVVMADFVESLESSGDVQWTETFTAQGFYGGGIDSVAFDLTHTSSGNTDTGDQEFSLTVDFPMTDADYSLNLDGTENGETGVVDQVVTATVDLQGATTELRLDLTETEAEGQTGSGTLSHQGSTIVHVTVEGNDFQYTDTNGDGLPSSDALAVDSLVRTLFLAGLTLLLRLPLLFV